MCEVPMDCEQSNFAAVHHNLIYKFLNYYHLPEDEYYDIVVFGYLKAVNNYLTKEKLQSYSFTTIAWKAMLDRLSNHRKSQRCQKRNALVISLQGSPYSNSQPLEELLPAEDELMKQLEEKLLLHDLASLISEQQMEIVKLKYNGYGIREIAKHQNVPMKRAQKLLQEVRSILMDLCYGY